LLAEQFHGGNMDNTVLSAFIPLVTAIFTEAIQILVEFIKEGSLREMKWWRALIVTTAVALVALHLFLR
jgi:hypothetical protein